MNLRTAGFLFAAASTPTLMFSSLAAAQAAPSRPAASPGPAAGAAAGASAAKPSTDNLAEARKHYEAGIELFDKEAYEAALSEFERAYQLAPSYKILYNTGKIYRARNDFVAALQAFDRFLKEGTDETPQRRTEVQHYVSELNSLIARVSVTSSISGADIAVDDVSQGTAPLDHPLLVNPGTRKITASKAGYSPSTQVVKAVPGDQLTVTLEPRSLTVNIVRSDPVPLRVWIGWGATVVLAGTGIGLGVAAQNQSNNLNNAKKQIDTSGNLNSQLNSDYNSMKTLAVVSDVFTACAIAAGLLSTYFTITYATRSKEQDTPAPVTVGVSPMGVLVAGKF